MNSCLQNGTKWNKSFFSKENERKLLYATLVILPAGSQYSDKVATAIMEGRAVYPFSGLWKAKRFILFPFDRANVIGSINRGPSSY